MIEDFLTIPQAPNFEINSELIVRRKDTHKILRHLPAIDSTGERVRLTASSFQMAFPVTNLRKDALEGMPPAEKIPTSPAQIVEDWRPVPSLNNLYELNRNGDLRNAATKTHLRRQKRNGKDSLGWYTINRKSWGILVTCGVASLLQEVFDIDSQVKKFGKSIAVTVSKEGVSHTFDSISAAADFLSTRIYYGASTVRTKLTQRVKKMHGWDISYCN